jgi:hypothetical protein
MTSKKALGKTADDLFSEESDNWGDLNGLSSQLIVKTETSEEITPKSEVMTKESRVLSEESKEMDSGIKTETSEEITPKSEVMTKESRVLSEESKETDSGIKTETSEEITPKSEVMTEESRVLSEENEVVPSTLSVRNSKFKAGSKKGRSARSKAKNRNEHPNISGVDMDLMDSIAEEARTKARIGTYSTISLAILKYMKKTVPEYSISDDARLLLEDGVTSKYPKLTKNLSLEKGTPRSQARDLDDRDYDKEMILRVAAEARDNPKITVWSPYAYAIFKYLRKTVPEFSISMEARVLLEEAVARKYPNLFEETNTALESI